MLWSVHLGVRIQDFHSCHTGSNPVPTTNTSNHKPTGIRQFSRWNATEHRTCSSLPWHRVRVFYCTYLYKRIVMKHVYALLWLLLSINIYSQYCPALGPDQILPCGVNTATLTADLSQCGPGNNPNATTAYTVSQIP